MKCPNCNISPILQRYTFNRFSIIFCQKCLNGFTYPIPKNIGKYYDDGYWLPAGVLGIVKSATYRLFQVRRKHFIEKFLNKGEILDIGSGEGIFSKLVRKDFRVTSLDVPSAQIKNPEVIKTDFLKWDPGKKFDAIVFWESLEHTAFPQKYIQKAASLLKKNGYIFIEYPRADSWEARFFKSYWFHLDPPRHLSHLTPNGLDKILTRTKLTRISHTGVPAFEYTIAGFMASILNLFPYRPVDFFKNPKNSFFIVFLIPLIVISAVLETVFFSFGQSPIYLTVAKKMGNN